MKMDFGLFQQQTTNLYMTAELRQAISLLQYSALELAEYLQEQALENPLIELVTEKKDVSIDREVERSNREERDETGYVNKRQSVSPLDFATVKTVSLSEHLTSQLRLMQVEKKQYVAVDYLIHHLDEAGYLHESLSDIANELQMSEQELEECLLLLQSFEPSGIGARTLQECLLLQVRHGETSHPLTEIILSHHLEALAMRKWNDISQQLQVPLVEIQMVYDEIQQLDPRPGLNYSHELPRYIVPDVKIEQVAGEWSVTLYDEYIPKITLNRQYVSLLQATKPTEESEYVKKKHEQMKWMIQCINQRQSTLLSVTEAIVAHQADFFTKGVDGLKPLTMREIGDEIGVHESTVSRVTTNKYAQTPKGLLELKSFFSVRASKNDENVELTNDAVKNYLQIIIDEEDKRKPLSDQKIVNILAEDYQVHVSRRTIAKYREELHIPASSKRKRYE